MRRAQPPEAGSERRSLSLASHVHTPVDSLLPEQWWDFSVADIAALTPVQLLRWPLLADLDIEIGLKRDDLLHPYLSGNKFYKLFGHIAAYRKSAMPRWLTFGGPYSNHLIAFAAASTHLAIPAVAVIRGERPRVLSSTLADVQAMGTELRFVSRSEYRQKQDAQWLDRLRTQVGDFYCVPEGGSGVLGASGCADWVAQALLMAPWRPTALCLAAGTGCSAAGALTAAEAPTVHAYLSLKGSDTDNAEFAAGISSLAAKLARQRALQRHLPALVLESNYHCGGYARFPHELRNFMLDTERQLGVLLDPVYTAKLFYGIAAQVRAGVWPRGSRLLLLHTGGLQGRRGFAGLSPA